MDKAWEYFKRFDRWALATPKRRAIYWLLSALSGTLTVISALRDDPLSLMGVLLVIGCATVTVFIWFRAIKYWQEYTHED